MPEVYFTEQALSDLERIFEFLEQQALDLAIAVGEQLVDASQILQRHPLIGRSSSHNMRELVIASGRSGYVALHRFLEAKDRVDILAIRHWLESGFSD